MTLDTYTFAVYPADMEAFDAFLLDVPSHDQGHAARRAYFTAMAHMAARGFDVEDFNVCVWVGSDEGGRPGPLVGPAGIAGNSPVNHSD
jgi:hypothetical protein